MKILIHDYAGHAFQMQLSKKLAEDGHSVVHCYFAGDPGPKGDLRSEGFANGGSITVSPLGKRDGYSKSSFRKRLWGDLEYRSALRRFMRDTQFDVILSGNTPLWVQGALLSAARQTGAAFIFWCQDFYSLAVSETLKAKLGVIGKPIEWILSNWDCKQFKNSDHVVLITDQFVMQTDVWGLPRDRVSVIPNWGALGEIPVCDPSNDWAQYNSVVSDNIVLYSGTLGLKHNPELILKAADSISADFFVVGFGVGYDELSRHNKTNLRLLPLQPFNVFPEVLGTSTVLIAVIEREAGNFSVPSKVLSYLCAGRPIVLAAPSDNLASSIIKESGAGLVVEPEDSQGFTEAIKRIIDDPDLAKSMGKAGRRYAEENFDIDIVTSRFEEVFEKALGRVK